MSNRRKMIDLTDSDKTFLFGAGGAAADAPFADVDTKGLLPHAFRRALVDSGAAETLEQLGAHLEDFPRDAIPVHFAPDWAQSASKREVTMDIISLMLQRFTDKKADDERFEKATDRWRKAPDRVAGYVPSDAGSIRWTMLPKTIMEPFDYRQTSSEEGQARTSDAIGVAWAYLATPFFIPAVRALDVTTAVPPRVSIRREIRLPFRYTMVFHDGVPLTVVAGDDDVVDEYAEGNALIRDDALLLGAVIAADDDLAVDDRLAFLIIAKPTDNGHYSWRAIPVPLTVESAASWVVWNYAAVMAWEGWSAPPAVSGARGKAGSRGHLRTVARTPEGQQGGYHGVWVLDHRPPSVEELEDEEPHERRSGRELKYQHTRRAHWRHRVRVGIRDENDNLVGPVFGPNAVEGVTFTRSPRLIPRKTVREDLPERPGPQERVYRVPANIRRG